MHAIAAAGAGFLIAVLWFDLMFDVQARLPGAALPEAVLASISAYYRRVTTEASPMGRLVSVAMLVTVAAIVGGLLRGEGRRGRSGRASRRPRSAWGSRSPAPSATPCAWARRPILCKSEPGSRERSSPITLSR